MIDLSGKWISSFIQNNKIYNEDVEFKQDGNKVSADITLNFDGEMCKYKFSGTIGKRVINGTYEYSSNSDIESGTISLKIINDDFIWRNYLYFS